MKDDFFQWAGSGWQMRDDFSNEPGRQKRNEFPNDPGRAIKREMSFPTLGKKKKKGRKMTFRISQARQKKVFKPEKKV